MFTKLKLAGSNAQLGWPGARLPAARLGTSTAARGCKGPARVLSRMLSLQTHGLAAAFHQDNTLIPAACNQP